MGKTSFSHRRSGKGLLVIISSPSGGGKSTVIRALRRRHAEFLYSISTTTRDKRRGERSGSHYNFVSPEQFNRLVKTGQLVEWASVHDQFMSKVEASENEAFAW